MNTFSKVMSLGLLASLLVSVPAFAGKHDDRDEKCCYNKHKHDEKCCNDKHDRDEKCSIVGAYTLLIGDVTSGNGVAEFNADGTMTLSLIEDSNPNFPTTGYVGLWKCTGNNCFKFLATNVLATVTCTPPNTGSPCGVLNPDVRLTFTANFCFDSTCQTASGTLIQNQFALTDLALKTPTASPESFTITLQRVNI